jgi:glycosyltransferase involved in cell wall biosynthesis
MNRKPLITFIVPVYDVEDYLSKCIESILYQSFHDIEIILIYDKSEDNSLNICMYYVSKYNNIRLIYGNGKGCGAARNLGINASNGDFIIFSDSDDYLSRDLCATVLPYLNDQKIDFINFGYCFVNNDGKIIVNKQNFLHKSMHGIEIFKNSFLDVDINPVPWNKVIRKSLITNNNILFPETEEWEDVLFTRMISFYSRNTLFIPMSLYYALIRENSRSRSFSENFFKNGIKLLQIEQNFLIKNNCLERFSNYYESHYLKILTFFFVKLGFQKNSFKQFINIFYLLKNSNYFIYLKNPSAVSLLPLKYRLILLFSKTPKLLWILINFINLIKTIKVY